MYCDTATWERLTIRLTGAEVAVDRKRSQSRSRFRGAPTGQAEESLFAEAPVLGPRCTRGDSVRSEDLSDSQALPTQKECTRETLCVSSNTRCDCLKCKKTFEPPYWSIIASGHSEGV